SLLGVPGYPWYRLPIEFVLLVLAATGLEWTAALPAPSRSPAWRRAPALAPGLVMLGLLFWPTLEAVRTAPVGEKDRAYYEMAAWFDGHGKPGERIA
ncbi:MAG: hypothetical protein GTN89_05310, partial [Acidobacteria bacterium]|nr:hypothetical protein [Acidobacteriota bacterium]NIM61253.1 hypothetical protein [Acidobacteriota bacterium]NIO58751.1 hypothetical protein [Acidobacteriota bacterium]NIQ29787.1 hypothetical protein [Acidobacteriota bacterium]NIQ84858.1 hypothetical protein [Acidobacteriota bacterium]